MLEEVANNNVIICYLAMLIGTVEFQSYNNTAHQPNDKDNVTSDKCGSYMVTNHFSQKVQPYYCKGRLNRFFSVFN